MKKCPVEALTKRGNLRYLDLLRQISRNNKKVMTEAEKVVWTRLLRKRQLGYKFLRQKPIGRFVVDFYCSKLLLAIEIDGGIHEKGKFRDRERDRYLAQRGIRTIRFKNEEVLGDLSMVKRKLDDMVKTPL